MNNTKTYFIEYRGYDNHYRVLWHFLFDHLFTLYRIIKTTGGLENGAQIIIRGIQEGKTDTLIHFYKLLSDKPIIKTDESNEKIEADYFLGQVMGSGPWEDQDSKIYLSLSDRPQNLSEQEIDYCYKNFRKRDPLITEELQSFKQHVLNSLNIKVDKPEGILLVKRRNANVYGRQENRAYINQEEFIEELSSLGFPICDVFLEDYKPEEEIELIASHEIVICPVGSSSSLSMFLPKGGTLIVLFPPDFCYPLSRIFL